MKDRAEPILAGLAWQLRPRIIRNGTIVLAYHNVCPPGEVAVGESALHLPWARFCDHLELLAEYAEVVTLISTLQRPRPRARLRVALTFDDAYASAVEFALPEVARRGLFASMFVAPGLLDGRSFWWDQLAQPLGGALPIGVRKEVLETLEGKQERVPAWAADQGLSWASSMPSWATGASTASLRSAAALPGISIESHSWSHANLAALTGDVLSEELEAPRRWLRTQGMGRGDWLAYPYGLANSTTARAAKAAGYLGALMVSGGFLRLPAPQHQLPRLNIPSGLSSDGLKLRLAGWRVK